MAKTSTYGFQSCCALVLLFVVIFVSERAMRFERPCLSRLPVLSQRFVVAIFDHIAYREWLGGGHSVQPRSLLRCANKVGLGPVFCNGVPPAMARVFLASIGFKPFLGNTLAEVPSLN